MTLYIVSASDRRGYSKVMGAYSSLSQAMMYSTEFGGSCWTKGAESECLLRGGWKVKVTRVEVDEPLDDRGASEKYAVDEHESYWADDDDEEDD